MRNKSSPAVKGWIKPPTVGEKMYFANSEDR